MTEDKPLIEERVKTVPMTDSKNTLLFLVQIKSNNSECKNYRKNGLQNT